MAITKVINDAVDLNQTTDYSGLRLPVGTTGNVVESFTTDYLVVGGGGSGSLQGAGGAGGLRTSYNNSTTTTNTLSFPSGKTAIATYMLDNNATDVSENYNGAETNITYNTGQYGGAAVFNGSSSNISISGSIINSLTSITYSVWVYYRGNVGGQSYGHIVGGGGTSIATGNAIALAVQNSNDYLYSYSPTATSFSTTALPRNTWTHLALTNDGSTTTIYMNGNSVHTASQSLSTSSSGNAFRIGEYFYNGTHHFYGSIDQVRIYDTALSSNDVTNIYTNEVQANSGGGSAAESSLTLTAGTAYDVTIGAGGIDTYTSGGSSESGANSIFSTITSIGGGGAGATSSGAVAASGKNGGSGGGAGSNTGGSPGNGTLGQGYIGGTALFFGGSYAGGGGGSATSSGGNTTSSTVAGNGGAQLNLAITGNSVGYAGGGGGSLYGTGTVGTNDSSAGAAAPSGSSSANGESAPFNLGGGGGGSNHITGITNITGGAGGSGVVILRYPTASVSSFTTTGTLNTPSTTDTIADTAYPVANTAYYKLDNSAIDLSGSTGKFDQGGVFNGSSSYVSINSSTALQLLGDYTVSFWFKTNALSGTQRLVNKDNANDYSGGWGFLLYSNGTFNWSHNDGSNNQNWNINAGTISTNTWYNVCAVYSDSNNLRTFYLNGSSVGTIATNTNVAASTDNLFFGTYGASSPSGQYLNGSLDQVRIYSTALSSSDVTALFNETVSTTGQLNFPSGQTAIATYELNGNANGILTTTDLSTVNYPAGAGCIALYEMNGTADDTSGAYNGTPSNIDYNFGAFGQAAVFNGSSSYISLPPGVRQNNNFTASLWFNTNTISAPINLIAFRNGKKFQVQLNGGVGNGGIRVNAGNNTTVDSASGIVTVNNWNHLAVVQSSTTGLTVYLNNSIVASNSGATGDLVTVTGIDSIGSYAGTANFMDGSIDQIRVFNTALTGAQVTTLARGIGTSYSGADTNVSYAYNGTPTNVTYGNGRFGQAANFNGSSSKITTSYDALFNDFSISFWVKMNALSYYQVLLGTTDSFASLEGLGMFYDASLNTIGFDGNINGTRITAQTGSYQITQNQWHHVVFTNNSSNNEKILYIDNNQQVNNTSLGYIDGQNYDLVFGSYNAYSNNRLNGSIDQVRIYDAALDSGQVTQLYNEHYQTKFTDGSDTAIVFTQGTGTVTFSGVDPTPPQGALRANTSYSEDGSVSVIEHYNGTGWKYFDAIKYCTTNTLNFPSGAGCIASYNLNNNVNDIGNTYNGVNSNVTFNASGKFGAAAVFNGSSSYVLASSFMPTGSNPRSASAWVKTTISNANMTILFSGSGSNNNAFIFRVINGKLGVAFYANDHDFTATGLTDGNWHHVVATYDGSVAKVYLDGNLIGTGSAGAVSTNSGNFAIGAYNNGVDALFNGSIDQVRIFNDSLTSDEVTQLYNNEIACS